MKKSILGVLLLSISLSVVGCDGEDCERKYEKMEGYSCKENCVADPGCDFTDAVFHIFRTDDGECSKIAFNEEDFMCGNPKYCERFDLTTIDIFKKDGGEFSCSGELMDDGIHLFCEVGDFNGQHTCQEAIFERIYNQP